MARSFELAMPDISRDSKRAVMTAPLDGTTVDPSALKTCRVEKSPKTAYLNRNRAQRIPSWPVAHDTPTKAEYICAD